MSKARPSLGVFKQGSALGRIGNEQQGSACTECIGSGHRRLGPARGIRTSGEAVQVKQRQDARSRQPGYAREREVAASQQRHHSERESQMGEPSSEVLARLL
eukprot:scaffold12957_cov92-Isochrysis_galbana.AAC.3